jgi:hypothetical protein
VAALVFAPLVFQTEVRVLDVAQQVVQRVADRGQPDTFADIRDRVRRIGAPVDQLRRRAVRPVGKPRLRSVEVADMIDDLL